MNKASISALDRKLYNTEGIKTRLITQQEKLDQLTNLRCDKHTKAFKNPDY